MTLHEVEFEGHRSVRVDGEASELFVTVSVGPRVLGCVVGGTNLFAVLPEAELDAPGGERYRLLGGHRLWAAPEIPAVTYRPDDRPCETTELADGVRVEAPPDGAGLVKAIAVRPDAGGGWIVEHELRNASSSPVTIAPWAITQLRPGGEAVLPVPARGIGPQADRSLVLWPYTDLGDRRIRTGRREVRVDASTDGPPTKVGVAPSDGRIAYRLGGYAFEKRIELDPDGVYTDRGAAVQVYIGGGCCELETLGPLRELAPGGRAEHRERWSLRSSDAPGRP
ncbi:MAG: hypothetical protein ACRDG8_06890 [Actinomycetota bacterium]